MSAGSRTSDCSGPSRRSHPERSHRGRRPLRLPDPTAPAGAVRRLRVRGRRPSTPPLCPRPSPPLFDSPARRPRRGKSEARQVADGEHFGGEPEVARRAPHARKGQRRRPRRPPRASGLARAAARRQPPAPDHPAPDPDAFPRRAGGDLRRTEREACADKRTGEIPYRVRGRTGRRTPTMGIAEEASGRRRRPPRRSPGGVG